MTLSPPRRRHENFPALDGLRALAVGGVVAYHLSPAGLPGGFLGVDVFFVLSGFLITRLLLAEKISTGRIRLSAFWARRAKRLLPGLLLMLCAVALTSMAIPEIVNPYELRGDGMAALFYYANWHFLAVGQSYFGQVGPPSPLEHTWTLAIEEQFYIVWPLLLLGLVALVGKHSPRRLVVPVAALALVSAAGMALVYGSSGLDAAYFSTECRAFELLVGALMAIWLTAGRKDLAVRLSQAACPSLSLQATGVVALAGIGTAMVLARPDRFLFDGGLVLVAIASALVVLAALAPGPVRSLFSVRPLRSIGRISYEIYLWHWPVIVVADGQIHLHGTARVVSVIGVTLVLAVLSYRLVDARLRRADFRRAARRAVVPVSIACTSALMLAAVPVAAQLGALGAPTKLGALGTRSQRNVAATASTRALQEVFGVPLGPPLGTVDLGWRPSRQHPVRVMFIGDSVMFQLQLAIAAGLDSTGDARLASYGAILGWSPRNGSEFGELRREIARTHPDLVVAMWTQDNTWIAEHGIDAYRHQILGPLLRLVLDRGDGVRGLVFAAQPPQPPLQSWMPDVRAAVYDPKGSALWELATQEEAHALPGRVAWVPATPMLELSGHYTTWLWSPGGGIERVRQIDDFHLCLNGGVRYGAGAVQGIVRLLALPEPSTTWWLGRFAAARRWDRLPGYPPGQCPNDAPASLHGTPG